MTGKKMNRSRQQASGLPRARRGQAEIIGGMIILTILIALIIPVVINSFTDINRLTEDTRAAEARIDLKLKERLNIAGVSQDRVGPDLWPSIWINNTGIVQVSLEYMYLIDMQTGVTKAVIDLTKARPWNSPIIKEMLLNPDPSFITSDPIPNNTAIQLKPGDKLFIVFNSTHPALLNPESLIVRVLSSEGVLHPVMGGGEGNGALVPKEGGNGTLLEPWKGAFNPYAGFKIIGGDNLEKNGKLDLYVPKINMEEPIAVMYSSAFIYDDEEYPGLYKLVIDNATDPSSYIGGFRIRTNYGNCIVSAESKVEFRGFIGTYHYYTIDHPWYGTIDLVYVYGAAADIKVNGHSCFGNRGLIHIDPTETYEISDFDSNGVNDLVLYTYKNGPNYGLSTNPNADKRGTAYDDVAVWSYMASRDISGQDFIRVTLKVNYYPTEILLSSGYTKPARDLRTFMIAVWEYDNNTNKWILRHYKDYTYIGEIPKQYQVSAVFPLDRNKTYRVGILFYDPYKIVENNWSNETAIELTYSLEYIVVEYGRYNPLFSVTPPIYIVAIPDYNKIRNIGETEYMTVFNITNIQNATLQAQAALLTLVEDELEKAGITDYVVIREPNQLCKLLFSDPTSGLPDTPPKRAIIIWLQGDMDISSVTGGCANNNVLKNKIVNYHWIFVQLSGDPMWGSLAQFAGSWFNVQATTLNANITDAGIIARIKYKAYLMPITAEYVYTITSYNNACILENATFYSNTTGTNPRYGSVAIWTDCNPDPTSSGLLVLSTTDIDWAGDGGGIQPEALVEIAVYSALEAYRFITS